MVETESSNKRLAKNTLILYVRTLVTMFIGLFTSRVLLDSLGIDNYGIYNVVGGFVAMFSVITGTLTATTQRYLTFELGKKDGNPKKIFGACICIHFGLAAFMLIVFETFGIWFLNTKLNIPEGRLFAANICFQLSAFASLLGLFSTPYNGVIIAHEKMKAFAYISLQDAILKLLICYLLYITPFDKLIVYASLFTLIMCWDQCVYMVYCHKKFPEARISIVRDRKLYKSMFNFAGMNFIGAFAHILSTQGVNMVLNIFFGITVNAARGIANQVQSAIARFSNDFMTALNPQITKEYAAGNKQCSMELCFRGAKFSFFLMLVFALPIIIRAQDILGVWLKEYPNYSVPFLRCSMLISLLGVLSGPLITEILATGNLTSTTWWIGGTRLLVLPLVYLVFKIGGTPVYAYVVVLGMDIVLLLIRLRILNSIAKMPFLKSFFVSIFPRISIVLVCCTLISLLIDGLIVKNILGLFLFAGCSVISTALLAFMLGLTNSERKTILSFVKSKIFKKKMV